MTIEILVGIIIALVSGIVGSFIGSSGKVQKPLCDQMRSACSNLLIEKIDHMSSKLEALTRVVDSKILGL